MEDKVYIVEDNVCIAGNILWGMYCGWQDISCGRGIVEDQVYIVGNTVDNVTHNIYVFTHNIYVFTHNTYPQYVQTHCGECIVGGRIYPVDEVLWRTKVYIVGNMLWGMYCG